MTCPEIVYKISDFGGFYFRKFSYFWALKAARRCSIGILIALCIACLTALSSGLSSTPNRFVRYRFQCSSDKSLSSFFLSSQLRSESCWDLPILVYLSFKLGRLVGSTTCSRNYIYWCVRLAALGQPGSAHSGEPLTRAKRTITLALLWWRHAPHVTPKWPTPRAGHWGLTRVSRAKAIRTYWGRPGSTQRTHP